jgi:hypothetical protein
VGISQGYATLGKIGFGGRFDYAAIGTVTNFTSCLCDEAAGEQISASQRLYNTVEVSVEAVTVGELSLKGFSRPTLVCNVVGLREAPSHENKASLSGGSRRPVPLRTAVAAPPHAHREDGLAVPVRYRHRGLTLMHQTMCVIYQPSSVLAAVTSEVSGDRASELKDGGGLHAAASH